MSEQYVSYDPWVGPENGIIQCPDECCDPPEIDIGFEVQGRIGYGSSRDQAKDRCQSAAWGATVPAYGAGGFTAGSEMYGAGVFRYWQVRYRPSLRVQTCYAMIWMEQLDLKWISGSQVDFVLDLVDPFEWTGTPPCGVPGGARDIVGDWKTVSPPENDFDSFRTHRVKKFSALPGYAPVDPIYSGDAYTPSRPCPDPWGNGLPFPESRAGCLDPGALNYNPLATCHDASCIYEEEWP